MLNELRAPDLLVLDWFGIQPASNKKRDRDQAALLCALSGHWIGAVLEARYADNRQTLLIADCDLETLKRGLGRERLFYVQIIGF